MTPFEIDVDRRYKHGQPFINLYGVGDIHYGARGCSVNKFRRDIKRIIDDPLALVILMGDHCDYVATTDKRYDPRQLDEDLDLDDVFVSQQTPLIEILRPLADQGKILCALEGNHEETVRLRYHYDVHKHFCARLGVRQAATCAGILLRCHGYRGKSVVTANIFVHHGAGAAQTKGGKINRLAKVLSWYPDGDVYMMGHVHESLDWADTALYVKIMGKKPRVVHRDRKLVITGSYLRTYVEGMHSSYGEKKMYSPTKMGYGLTQIRIDRENDSRYPVFY